ncbi:MAG: DUF3574 domain-containing protein [Prochloraceae cyanobacterium]|nr:DUF3574 domain-containing protein [Prochloraceae cyanobacterium]
MNSNLRSSKAKIFASLFQEINLFSSGVKNSLFENKKNPRFDLRFDSIAQMLDPLQSRIKSDLIPIFTSAKVSQEKRDLKSRNYLELSTSTQLFVNLIPAVFSFQINNFRPIEVVKNNLFQNRTNSLIQVDLFFGENINKNKAIFEVEFAAFLDKTITPKFPDRLTVFDAIGQFRDNRGNLIEENSKVVTLFVEDTRENSIAIEKIIREYSQEFDRDNILQVTNKDELKISFGAARDLIDNDLIPELIEVSLFFGRNLPGGGEVSDREFAAFLDKTITPRFPDGLTVFEAQGQFHNSRDIIGERSKVVTLLIEDTVKNEIALNEIIKTYIQQFKQQSVSVAVNENIAVAFDPGLNIIDNDPIPELISADLFFGRNIPGGGEVSDAEFGIFVDRVISPRFPDRLTVFDADGQFRNSSGTIIEERSKVVTLLFEDTPKNEAALDKIMEFYLKQFNQESVLLVVDEDIEVNVSSFLNNSLVDNYPISS